MKRETCFKQTHEACNHFGLNREITAEQCWNEGYRLGRSRWYWGPSWFVTLRGWLNTQRQKLRRKRSLSEL